MNIKRVLAFTYLGLLRISLILGSCRLLCCFVWFSSVPCDHAIHCFYYFLHFHLNHSSVIEEFIADDASFIAVNSFSLIAQSHFMFSRYGIAIKLSRDLIFVVSYAGVHTRGVSLSHHSFSHDHHTAHANHGDVNISFTRSTLFFALFITLLIVFVLPLVCISWSILTLSADGILSIPIIPSITDCASGDNCGVDPCIHGVPVAHAHVISLYNPGLSFTLNNCCL